MTPHEWDRIKEIFSAALNVPSAEREAFVRSSDGSAEVQQAVHELLRAHFDASKTFLDHKTIVIGAPWLFAEGDRVADRFAVTRRIARGAMGEVYQVYDERLRLHVALKAIRPELVGDAETAERFRREVLVTRDIAHEGLCRIFDLVEHESGADGPLPEGTTIPCLTMQLLEGETLEEWLAGRRPVSVADALPLIEQIADALQVLHDAGVIHRDLKPSNVMLVPSSAGMRAVLTDFGLAKPLVEGVFETQVRVQGGAPYFMAPELFRGERPSQSSDVYALGLLIDEMVTSRRAFSSDSLHALLLQKLGDGPERPSSRADALPRAWDRAIRHCLAADPRHRPQSPRAVVDALTAQAHWLGWAPRSRWRIPSYTAAAVVIFTGAATMAQPLQDLPPKEVFIGNFANLSNDPDLDYLSAGTAGELERRLGRVRELRVYRQRDPSLRVDASQPAFALQGDITQKDALLQITVKMTDLAKGTPLWSRTFEGPRDASMQLEQDLAASTAAALGQLQPEGGTRSFRQVLVGVKARLFPSALPSQGTSNTSAFDAYMRGRVLYEERTLTTALRAIDNLKRAIALDDNFAAAHASLADVQQVLMDLHYAPHSTLIAEADAHATRAVEINPNLPEAQVSLASVRQMQWRWEESEAAYRRAIELHPTFARAYRWYGGLVLQFGRIDESLSLIRHGLELDPYDYPNQAGYGHALFTAGRLSEAVIQLERVIGEKDFFNAQQLLGQTYAVLAGSNSPNRGEYLRKALRQADIVRARESAERARTVTEYADLIAAIAWSYAGRSDAAQPFVDRLEAGRAHGHVSPSILARVYAVQHDSARAVSALLDAEAQGDRELLYIGVSPLYASIRDDAQFRALLGRLRLSQ